MSDEFVTVPYYIEPDGSKTHFLPGLRQGQTYRIGKKGGEHLVADYWEALKLVCAMPKPRFRRKNNEGNAGLVTCQPGQVEEVSLAAIEDQLAQLAGETKGREG